MKPFSLLVKPASSACNLRCSYCFYIGHGAPESRMSPDLLETMTRKYLALRLPASNFGWQGGEPTLMGLDFFKLVLELQRRHSAPGQQVANALQTNGTLIDGAWAEFLAGSGFLTGISIDGPQAVHDISRRHANSEAGSHVEAMRGLRELKKAKAEFNILSLVSAANQDRPLEVYSYLKSIGANYHQYIECVEFDASGALKPCSVNPRKWGEFLCAVFDEWFKADTRKVSVRLFDTILGKLLDNVCSSCAAASDCRSYFVIESDGGVYPCDFHVRPEFRLGDIASDQFQTLLDSPLYKSFGAKKREQNGKCRSCEFLNLCAGCCPKNRPGGNPHALSAICEGWKIFYTHTIKRFETLAGEISKERKLAARMNAGGLHNPDRNTPCPCGSGRKFKKCCGA